MENNQKLLDRLQGICTKQHEEIEQKKVQVWDLEEENRMLRKRVESLLATIDEKERRIEELEEWCRWLEKRKGLIFRVGHRVKKLFKR